MTSFTQNLTAADQIARYTVEQRVHDAEHRARVKELRAERRTERRAQRQAARDGFETSISRLPTWALRFAHPVH